MQELLARSKVFRDTHEEFIRDLIVSCNRREYPVNRYIMEEGMKGDSMCRSELRSTRFHLHSLSTD
ncbi:unnamed protein product [Symbiodinium necroappetens]|uniref:Uncharacterized protein n=1 Tax=Symbiodinium necroappetens TaxID=1628268 RepID=A0A812QXZ6_9DINO|nr:unnamed protein product [Symbiodinium necroappetens]